jgi:hypothetical protein
MSSHVLVDIVGEKMLPVPYWKKPLPPISAQPPLDPERFPINVVFATNVVRFTHAVHVKLEAGVSE